MQLLEIGSSAGGARAKAIVAWNEKTGEVKSGQVDAGKGFDYWLIKFDGVSGNGDHNLADKKQYSLIEYAYYLMAVDLGIEMSECRIYEKDGLHSLNKDYPVMHFEDEDSVYLIGRVLGILDPAWIASQEEVRLYTTIHNE